MVEALPQLTEGQKEDARAALKRLTGEVELSAAAEIVEKAKRKLAQIRSSEPNQAIIAALGHADRLIEFVERHEGSARAHHRRVALAALDYLVDPWEVIPDFIPAYGLLDDIYVLEVAIKLVATDHTPDGTISSSRKFVQMLPIAAGQHFAHRAMEKSLLGPGERALLSLVSNRQLAKANIDEPACERFVEITSSLVGLGMLDSACRVQNCVSCRKLAELVA